MIIIINNLCLMLCNSKYGSTSHLCNWGYLISNDKMRQIHEQSHLLSHDTAILDTISKICTTRQTLPDYPA